MMEQIRHDGADSAESSNNRASASLRAPNAGKFVMIDSTTVPIPFLIAAPDLHLGEDRSASRWTLPPPSTFLSSHVAASCRTR